MPIDLITNWGAYQFSEWKLNWESADDAKKLVYAIQLVSTAQYVLESIDDELIFAQAESAYETLTDVRYDIANVKVDVEE